MWLMPDRKTVWLRQPTAHDPMVFYSGPDGKKSGVGDHGCHRNSVTGYPGVAAKSVRISLNTKL